MKHARAWAASSFPGAPVLEAGKRVVWIPDGKGGRMPRSLAEDLFGVFDLAVFPLALGIPSLFGSELDERVQLVQVTTYPKRGQQPSALRSRRQKVATWVKQTLSPDAAPPWLGRILLLAWEERTAFRAWEWSWIPLDSDHPWGWREIDPIPAPLPPKARRTP